MNEPVAYGMLTFCKNCGEQNPYAVEELTDKEIMQIAQTHGLIVDAGVYEFAKAILRKAQKK